MANIKYYPYVVDPKTGFDVYAGVPVEVDDTEPQPPNTSTWAPLPTQPGKVTYFYNGAWAQGANVSAAPFSELQDRALTEVIANFENDVDALNAGYSASERASWNQQYNAAQSVLSGGTSNLLNTLAQARNMDVKVLAQKIVDKNTTYNTEYATILGKYQALKDSIAVAERPGDLPAFAHLTSLF